MQLFLDIDGVLLNFEQSFVRWLNGHFAMNLPEDYQANSWDFTEVLEAEELERRWRLYLASPEAARMAPLVEPERFNALSRAHSVHLVTNFPLPHMDKRLANLADVGLAYRSLHHCGFLVYDGHTPKTKGQTVAELLEPGQAALFVDDHPDNCLDVARTCPDVEVWVMTRRFNRAFSHPQVRRAADWESLFQRLGAAEGGQA
jgi:FMN phosphatase YigB (HAD superfamily)